MIGPVAYILAVPALLLAGVVVRERLRLARAVRIRNAARRAVRSAAAPEPATSSLLENPGDADGWLLATPEGDCALASEGACRLLQIERPERPGRLDALFGNGDPSIVAELRNQSVIRQRRVHAPGPDRPIELAGIALRDGAGNLTGAALFIRAWRPVDLRR